MLFITLHSAILGTETVFVTWYCIFRESHGWIMSVDAALVSNIF